jgi:hypothetical protein
MKVATEKVKSRVIRKMERDWNRDLDFHIGRLENDQIWGRVATLTPRIRK